ncbi:MAG: hypothetical protein U0Q12_23030 [Vicinamibacterales bacterium]
MRDVWVAALGVAVAAASPTPGAAGSTGRLAGRVELVAKGLARTANASVYASRMVTRPSVPSARDPRDVVIAVAAPAGGTVPVAEREIVQRNETFLPHVTAVTVGSSVTFPNDDPWYHNVFSLSRAGTFDLGRYPQGETRTRTFKTAGVVKVYCNLHANMSATIVVLAHPYFATPDADGRFAIDGVPAGTFTVKLWHERAGATERRVEIRAGMTTTLDALLPVADEQ